MINEFDKEFNIGLISECEYDEESSSNEERMSEEGSEELSQISLPSLIFV